MKNWPARHTPPVAGAAVSSTALLDAELPTQLIHAIRVQFDQGSIVPDEIDLSDVDDFQCARRLLSVRVPLSAVPLQ